VELKTDSEGSLLEERIRRRKEADAEHNLLVQG
jgi:hypothetical protein